MTAEQTETDIAAELHARAEQELSRCEFAAAAQLAEDAASRFLAVDPAHPDAANAVLLRARVEHARSRYFVALELAARARAIVDASLVTYPDEPIVAQLFAHSTCQIVLALQALGRYSEAEALLLQTLPLVEQRLPGTLELAHVHNLLGICHKYLARYAAAKADYARAIAIITALPGDMLLDRARLEHNLGGLDHARGDLERAETHARRSVEMVESMLGPEHVLLAPDLAALGTIVCDRGRFAEAEQLLQRALASFERAFGESHFEVGFTLGALGALHIAQRRWELARTVLDRAHAVLLAVVGKDHLEVARVERYLDVLAERSST